MVPGFSEFGMSSRRTIEKIGRHDGRQTRDDGDVLGSGGDD